VLLNYHISRFVLGSLCVGDLVGLGFEYCLCCRVKHLWFNLQHINIRKIEITQRSVSVFVI